ncbi:hypothetical protein IMZ31_21505 (plasmid) [Pontibacillus sp. ALD_SL1]|uniref:hypothetical protein n=1 Tax=Pontibacillus sp. ALD_SL1 TaxID=2777185 RepID=UPI001A96901E|nr:hypothetical protein [Pontibacillus sp. ALD_SL1]QST02030.1 hypothetical protein IMZ31_21505 [Pontibacillus sp. ALD_SL1]
MRNIHEFAQEEREVIASLVDVFHYSHQEAMMVVEGYKEVITKIGFFENPFIWASKIDEALNNHITPDMWMPLLS